MAASLTAGNFRIVSQSPTGQNLPVGVNETPAPIQIVHVDAPISFWNFTEAGGDDKYLLGIGRYPFTGVIDNKIVASEIPDNPVAWRFSFQQLQAGYTITLANDPGRGWTINPDSGEIVISDIIVTASEPPRFLSTQLFVIEPFKL